MEQQLEENSDFELITTEISQCSFCARKFNQNAYSRHVPICQKVFEKKQEKILVVKNDDKENSNLNPDIEAQIQKDAGSIIKYQKQQKDAKWKEQSEQFRNCIKQNVNPHNQLNQKLQQIQDLDIQIEILQNRRRQLEKDVKNLQKSQNQEQVNKYIDKNDIFGNIQHIDKLKEYLLENNQYYIDMKHIKQLLQALQKFLVKPDQYEKTVSLFNKQILSKNFEKKLKKDFLLGSTIDLMKDIIESPEFFKSPQKVQTGENMILFLTQDHLGLERHKLYNNAFVILQKIQETEENRLIFWQQMNTLKAIKYEKHLYQFQRYIQHMIQTNSIYSVTNQVQLYETLAKTLAHPDTTVRQNTIDIYTQIGQQTGTTILKFLGKLPEIRPAQFTLISKSIEKLEEGTDETKQQFQVKQIHIGVNGVERYFHKDVQGAQQAIQIIQQVFSAYHSGDASQLKILMGVINQLGDQQIHTEVIEAMWKKIYLSSSQQDQILQYSCLQLIKELASNLVVDIFTHANFKQLLIKVIDDSFKNKKSNVFPKGSIQLITNILAIISTKFGFKLAYMNSIFFSQSVLSFEQSFNQSLPEQQVIFISFIKTVYEEYYVIQKMWNDQFTFEQQQLEVFGEMINILNQLIVIQNEKVAIMDSNLKATLLTFYSFISFATNNENLILQMKLNMRQREITMYESFIKRTTLINEGRFKKQKQ